MILTLHPTDFFALSPVLILLIFALTQLLIETFAENFAKKLCFPIALLALAAAFIAAIYAPISVNKLLTPWLTFDSVSRLFTLFFIGVGIGVSLLSDAFFKRFHATQGEFYFLLLSAIMGLIFIGSSANFLTLFLGLETLSIALYILCCYMKQWSISQESAIKFFLTGSIAAAVLLYGIALVYGAVGSTDFGTLLANYNRIAEPSNKALFLSGIALITLALGFKAAIFPFHQWAPDVYAGASTPVTAFLAVGSKAGAFAAFAKVFLIALPLFNVHWNEMIAWMAVPTLLYANFVALKQNQIRRFFAYSGISHAGFLLLPLAAGTPEAIAGLMFYLMVYAFATLGAFAVIAYMDEKSDGVSFEDLRGLFHQSPVAAGVLSLCLLTLAGIPPTGGFFAKFYLFKIAFQAGYQALVIVALLTTILSAYYYLRIIGIIFSDTEMKQEPKTLLWPAVATGLIAGIAVIALSFFPESFIHLARWTEKL